jgi:hypothetical protein
MSTRPFVVASELFVVVVGAVLAAMMINLLGHYALGFSDEELCDLALRGDFYVGLLLLVAYSVRKFCEWNRSQIRQARKAVLLASAAR